MNPRTKTYLKVGIWLTIGGIVTYIAYKIIDKKITDAKLRQQAKKDDIDKPDQSGPGEVKPEELVKSVGKTIYPKETSANVRSEAYVNNGMINNFIGKVVSGKPIGKILEATITGDKKVWYKVAVISANLTDDSTLGKANKKATTGYVREDVVTIK